MSSQGSSKPLSSDGPQTRRTKKKKPTSENKSQSNHKAGAQKAHQGKKRPLVSEDEVNEFVAPYADHGEKCHQELSQDETASTTAEIFRWQIFDIEPIKPKVIEYQAHTTICNCGSKTKATIPDVHPKISKKLIEAFW